MATPIRKQVRFTFSADMEKVRNARGCYRIERAYARALSRLVSRMFVERMSPREVAEFIRMQPLCSQIGLSHFIEGKAEDGTFAAAVFAILAD